VRMANYIIVLLIFLAAMWVGVPGMSLLLDQRLSPELWHELRILTIGWLIGAPLGAAIASAIRRIRGRRRR